MIQNQCLQIFHIITLKVQKKERKKSSDILNANILNYNLNWFSLLESHIF